jgi:hypothetical protein
MGLAKSISLMGTSIEGSTKMEDLMALAHINGNLKEPSMKETLKMD